MDQRVDSERRSDSGLGSGRDGDAAPGEAAAKAAKAGPLRNRRRLLTALIIGGVILAVLLGLW